MFQEEIPSSNQGSASNEQLKNVAVAEANKKVATYLLKRKRSLESSIPQESVNSVFTRCFMAGQPTPP